MKYIKLILFVGLLYSCTNENLDDKNEKSYLDKSFIQESHDGYIIDKEINCANDVRAIQVDKNDKVWIATKCGVYMKKPDSRQWELMIKKL